MGQKMGHFRGFDRAAGHTHGGGGAEPLGPPSYSWIGAPGCSPSVGWKAAAGVTFASTHGTGVVPTVRLGVTPLPYHRRRGRG